MTLMKSLLLGSVAGLAATAVAGAADLPARKAAPVEYVRVCSQYGAGFFYIPGSDTCVQISGRVLADTGYIGTNNRNNDSAIFGVKTRLNLDVRNNTPYGVVRAYLRVGAVRGDKNYEASYGYNGTGISGGGANVDQAYIQFGGLTVGRLQSLYDFYADAYNFAAIRSSDTYNTTLAYTATFGNGFSATLGIEDGNERRLIDNRYAHDRYGYYYSGGQTVPDVFGVLRADQSWGAAQLSAALHQIRPGWSTTDTVDYPDKRFSDTKYGYAVYGGLMLKLPMIAPGDEFWIEGGYSEGALSYLGANNYSFYQAGVDLPITEAFIDANGNVKRTKGWSIMFDYMHYWTPSVRQNVFASYMNLSYGNGGYSVVADPLLGTYNVGYLDASEWRVGTNLIWSPIKNFDIGVEVLYTRLDPKGKVLSDDNGRPKVISSDDSWQGRLRFQRDF